MIGHLGRPGQAHTYTYKHTPHSLFSTSRQRVCRMDGLILTYFSKQECLMFTVQFINILSSDNLRRFCMEKVWLSLVAVATSACYHKNLQYHMNGAQLSSYFSVGFEVQATVHYYCIPSNSNQVLYLLIYLLYLLIGGSLLLVISIYSYFNIKPFPSICSIHFYTLATICNYRLIAK